MFLNFIFCGLLLQWFTIRNQPIYKCFRLTSTSKISLIIYSWYEHGQHNPQLSKPFHSVAPGNRSTTGWPVTEKLVRILFAHYELRLDYRRLGNDRVKFNFAIRDSNTVSSTAVDVKSEGDTHAVTRIGDC